MIVTWDLLHVYFSFGNIWRGRLQEYKCIPAHMYTGNVEKLLFGTDLRVGFSGGSCCMPQYTLKYLLFAFQLADRSSGCNEWQNCWWGKDHSLFLSVAGGVCLHALICAAPLLLRCFFVLKSSLHTCTVVFAQKDNTKVAIKIIFMTRLVTPRALRSCWASSGLSWW